MRLFAIPDIHGRLDLLNKLLKSLEEDHGLDLSVDKIVFTGDYCDRGADTYGVIERLKKLNEQYPENVVCLAGNHEYINIFYFTRRSEDDVWLFENNGGPETLESYRLAGFNEMTQDHLKWLVDLPLKHEEPGFHFSHAPLPRESYRNILHRGQPYKHDDYIWTYHPDEPGVAADIPGIVQVVGHVHALKKGIFTPRFYDHVIYGDAGCGCSPRAPLVAIEVKTRQVVYVYP